MEKAQTFEVGDLGFYKGDSLFDKQIEQVEAIETPGLDYYPSHVFMCLNKDPLIVVEAVLNSNYNSVAAVARGAAYLKALQQGGVVIVRPPGSLDQKTDVLFNLINNYTAKPYGWWVLPGFLLQSWLHLKDNPLGTLGDVCSQCGWEYLSALQIRLTKDGDLTNASDIKLVLSRVAKVNSTPALLLQACQIGVTKVSAKMKNVA
jgi:hypothetical protein